MIESVGIVFEYHVGGLRDSCTATMTRDAQATKLPPKTTVRGRPAAADARPPLERPTKIIAAPRKPVARRTRFQFTGLVLTLELFMPLPNGSRLSCGALKKESSFNILRAPPASSAC